MAVKTHHNYRGPTKLYVKVRPTNRIGTTRAHLARMWSWRIVDKLGIVYKTGELMGSQKQAIERGKEVMREIEIT